MLQGLDIGYWVVMILPFVIMLLLVILVNRIRLKQKQDEMSSGGKAETLGHNSVADLIESLDIPEKSKRSTLKYMLAHSMSTALVTIRCSAGISPEDIASYRKVPVESIYGIEARANGEFSSGILLGYITDIVRIRDRMINNGSVVTPTPAPTPTEKGAGE